MTSNNVLLHSTIVICTMRKETVSNATLVSYPWTMILVLQMLNFASDTIAMVSVQPVINSKSRRIINAMMKSSGAKHTSTTGLARYVRKVKR